MPPGDTAELVIRLRDDLRAGSPDEEALRSTLGLFGIDLGDVSSGPASPLDAFRSWILPREVASRAAEALKGKAALEAAFVKPRGETP